MSPCPLTVFVGRVISVIQIVYLKHINVITDVFFIVLMLDNLRIVDDSLIHWAVHYLLPWGETALNLHLPKRRVTWKGFPGRHLSDVPFIIQQSINRYNGTWNWPMPVVAIAYGWQRQDSAQYRVFQTYFRMCRVRVYADIT